MLHFLKNLIKLKPTIETQSLNSTILEKLYTILYYKNIESLFINPVNKLYVLNTYTDSITSLLNNLPNRNFQSNLIAINIHSYFKDSNLDIDNNLTRIIDYLKTNTVSNLLISDLNELYTAFEYLKELENNPWVNLRSIP